MSFDVLIRAPEVFSKRTESPTDGAVPPQFAGSLHRRASPPPVHRRSAA